MDKKFMAWQVKAFLDDRKLRTICNGVLQPKCVISIHELFHINMSKFTTAITIAYFYV